MNSSANTNHCSCGAIKAAVYAVCPACLTAINRGEIANLRAQLAQAQERVGELEGKCHEAEELSFDKMVQITGALLGDDNFQGVVDDNITLRAQLAQRDAAIAELIKDQQWLDPGAIELIRAFGTFSIERLPDWNFAVAIKGDIYGIGMTVFDAISSAAAQIDKIKATIKETEENK